MPIVIPSKNIYSLHNQKTNDNFIKSVEVSARKAVYNPVETEKAIFSEIVRKDELNDSNKKVDKKEIISNILVNIVGYHAYEAIYYTGDIVVLYDFVSEKSNRTAMKPSSDDDGKVKGFEVYAKSTQTIGDFSAKFSDATLTTLNIVYHDAPSSQVNRFEKFPPKINEDYKDLTDFSNATVEYLENRAIIKGASILVSLEAREFAKATSSSASSTPDGFDGTFTRLEATEFKVLFDGVEYEVSLDTNSEKFSLNSATENEKTYGEQYSIGNDFFRSEYTSTEYACLERSIINGENLYKVKSASISAQELVGEDVWTFTKSYSPRPYASYNVVSYLSIDNEDYVSIRPASSYATINEFPIGVLVPVFVAEKVKTTADRVSNNILRLYGFGKETAEITCSIANYHKFSPKAKGFNGDKAISVDGDGLPMLFSVGDDVVPMVKTVKPYSLLVGQDENGNDVYVDRFALFDTPIAIEDGENSETNYAKVFRVINVSWAFDGELLQKIAIQETDRKVEYPKMTYDELLARTKTAEEALATIEGYYSAELAEAREKVERIDKYYASLPQGGVNEFWESFQNGGFTKDYSCSFGAAWTEKSLTPKYNIAPTNLYMGFAYNKIPDLAAHFEKLGVKLNTSNTTSMSHAFFYSTTTRIPEIDARATSSLTSTFYYCPDLEKIDKLILLPTGTQTFSLAFEKCYKLRHIVVDGVIGQNGWDMTYCSKLTKQSITSIINALSTNIQGRKTITISLEAVENAFGDYAQSADWINLVQPKIDAGWTISLGEPI